MAEEPTVAELAEETLKTASAYVRQQGRALVEEVAVEPVRRGAKMALAVALAAGLVMTGAVLLGVGLVIGLSQWLGSPVAGFCAAGALEILAGVGLVKLATRLRHREGSSTDDE
jgi:hypothetical protein